MARTQFKYGASDVGCYIDGAYGLRHARAKLEGLIAGFAKTEHQKATLSDLGSSEWYDEVMDEATDILQAHTDEDYVWCWESGDLILLHVDQVEA